MSEVDSKSGHTESAHKEICFSNCEIVSGTSDKTGCAGAWEAGAAVGYIGCRKLSRCLPCPSKQEFVSKIGVVAEEADETVLWLELLGGTGIMKASQLAPLIDEAHELSAIFTASYNTACGGRKFGNSALRQFGNRN